MVCLTSGGLFDQVSFVNGLLQAPTETEPWHRRFDRQNAFLVPSTEICYDPNPRVAPRIF